MLQCCSIKFDTESEQRNVEFKMATKGQQVGLCL